MAEGWLAASLGQECTTIRLESAFANTFGGHLKKREGLSDMLTSRLHLRR